jgi:hypothetical protein
MRACVSIVLGALWLVACDGVGDADPDAGALSHPDAGGGARDAGAAPAPDGGPDRCDADEECGDRTLFCTRVRCRPAEAGADAFGCVDLGSPCAPAEVCDEAGDTCGGALDWCTQGREGCSAAGDCDGDGAAAIECGGDDCADDDAGVRPGAEEACNGADDTCEGAIDERASCADGICRAGVCDTSAWVRTIGGASSDRVHAVAIDDAGSVYVAGVFHGSVDFGGGVESTAREAMYVAKYLADGSFAWVYAGPDVPGLSARVRDVAVSPDASHVFAVGAFNGDLGSGASEGGFLLSLDGDGEYVADRRFGTRHTLTQVYGVDVIDGDASVVGYFGEPADFGGGERTPVSVSAIVVARYTASAAYVWDTIIDGSADTYAEGIAIDVRADGSIVVAGTYTRGTITAGAEVLPGAVPWEYGLVAALDGAGALRWTHVMRTETASFPVHAIASTPTGEVVVVGELAGPFDPETGGPVYDAEDINGVMLWLSASGDPISFTGFGAGGGADRAMSVATDGDGVIVGGGFTTESDLGGGARAPDGITGFYARYSAAGVYRSDAPIGSGGFVSVFDVAVAPDGALVIAGFFSGDSDFGDGVRTAGGSTDGFVVYLGP